MELVPIILDDGQVIKGKLGDLSQHELISLANQLYRLEHLNDAYKLMQYQHKKFHETPSIPTPPKAA